MRRHTEGDNLVLCTVLIGLRRSMAAMATQNKQSSGAYCTRLSMPIRVL